jgi:hypothetical protein
MDMLSSSVGTKKEEVKELSWNKRILETSNNNKFLPKLPPEDQGFLSTLSKAFVENACKMNKNLDFSTRTDVNNSSSFNARDIKTTHRIQSEGLKQDILSGYLYPYDGSGVRVPGSWIVISGVIVSHLIKRYIKPYTYTLFFLFIKSFHWNAITLHSLADSSILIRFTGGSSSIGCCRVFGTSRRGTERSGV